MLKFVETEQIIDFALIFPIGNVTDGIFFIAFLTFYDFLSVKNMI
jgi:hypothetical protein